MFYRFFPLTLLLLSSLAAWSQTPQAITLQPGGKKGSQAEFLACPDQFAGTISFANFAGQSNDTDLDTIYFCMNDQINIIHNGDSDLTGDPNPGTTPGVTYGFFECPPSITGPNLTTILTDPCILDNPPPINGIWVTAGGSINGNILFKNTGTLQNTFNGGNPVLIWFAPLTIDDFVTKLFENDPNTGETGPCVNLNVDEAFAVVYLNEIKINNFDDNTGQSACGGSFDVTGGLPQFDGSNYSFNIQLVGNPSVKGTVTNGPITHGETVQFQVPVPGIYDIIVEDGKSCLASFLANMTSCVSMTQSIPNVVAAPNDQICLDVTHESGWLQISSIQYALEWDETVLEFDTVINLSPLIPGFTYGTSFNSLGDSLIYSWFSPSGNGVSLPNDVVLYQVCFTVVGGNGDCTDISFIPAPVIEVVNQNGNEIGFNGVAGSVCVSNSALVVNFTQDSVSCPGASDGSFTVTVSGGQAPYQVTWQNTAGGSTQGPGAINIDGGSFTVNNLVAGTYSVTVTDSQGTPLFTTEQVKVLSPPILSVLFNETPPLCNGQTGSISATLVLDSVLVNNPTQNYTFSWSNGGSTPTISNITSGGYTLTVTENATGCTLEEFTFLPQPPPLIVNVSVTSATCSGINDGILSVNVFGGTPDPAGDYVIQWPTIGSGLTVMGTMSNVNGLKSDYYQLIVTDNNGCVYQENIFLPAIKVLTVNAVINNVDCTSDCSGGIFVTGVATGGAPSLPYNFSWFGTPVPPPPVNTTATTSTMAGLCVGTYTLVLEDQQGCEIDTTFNIIAPNPLTASVLNTKNETCQPGMDGSITIGVTGGTYPYDYNWNTTATDSIATGLAAGSYTVIVEDAVGCADTVMATITAPQPPTITSLPDDVLSCATSTDGSLTVTATAGSAPITTYTWSNAGSGATISGLGAGAYIVTVTDQNNCTAVDTGQVVAPLPLVIDSVHQLSPQCPGLGGGTITTFVSGGTGPYFFNWSNGISGNGFNVNGNLTAGNYTVTITDANNCEPLVQTITLLDPPSIVATFSAIDSVSCANTGMTCDGTATASAAYSDGSTGTFDFTWQSGETDNNLVSSTAVQLCSGSQQLTISDGICFIDTTVVVPAPLPITPGQQIKNVSCNGLSDGQITLMPNGGTPPYTITWQGGQSGPTISGLAAGNFTAVITDSKNCTFTHTVTIIQPEPFQAFLNTTQTQDVSCPGETDGTISVALQGGNINIGSSVFLWENGVAPTNSNIATGLAAGTYSVTVVDPKGCEDSLTHTLTTPPPIEFTLGEVLPIQCFGQNTFVTVESVTGGNPTATYVFSVNNGIDRLPGEQVAVVAGNHIVTVTDLVNGCEADTTITINQPVEIIVELPAVVEIELGDSLTMLDPNILSSLPIDSFIWDPGDQLSCADCKNPRVTAIKNQLYTLTVIDVNGCTASASVLVDVDRNRNVFIPNVFSPNGDGINDKFKIFTGIGVTSINFVRLYDRWGELLFEETDLPPSPDGTPGWDGFFKGQKLNPAVFLYLVEVEFLDGKKLLYRGDVTLLR
jgi:gliding motility-associated-like protein